VDGVRFVLTDGVSERWPGSLGFRERRYSLVRISVVRARTKSTPYCVFAVCLRNWLAQSGFRTCISPCACCRITTPETRFDFKSLQCTFCSSTTWRTKKGVVNGSRAEITLLDLIKHPLKIERCKPSDHLRTEREANVAAEQCLVITIRLGSELRSDSKFEAAFKILVGGNPSPSNPHPCSVPQAWC
jgi:hypothetical protein